MRSPKSIIFYVLLIIIILEWLGFTLGTLVGEIVVLVIGGGGLAGLFVLGPITGLITFPWALLVLKKRNNYRWIWWITLLAIAIPIAVLCLGAQLNPHAPIKTENNEKVYITHIGNTEYHIPLKYTGHLEDNTQDVGLISSFPDIKLEELQHSHPNIEEAINILVTNDKSTTSVAYRFGVAEKSYGALRPNGSRFGLTAFTGSKENSFVIERDPSIKKEQTYEELFIDGSPENPDTYIACNGDKDVPYPGCRETFNANGLLFEVSFRKTHLEDWKFVRTHVIELLNNLSRQNSVLVK